MRLYRLIALFTGLTFSSFAQLAQPAQRTGRTKPVIYQASSEWQKVTFRPTLLVHLAPPALPASAPKRRTRVQPPASDQTGVDGAAGPASVAATQPALAPAGSRAATKYDGNSEPTAQPDAVAESMPPRRPVPSAPGYRPAFTGDFATNRNGWKAGNNGDYHYQIGLGKYNIRKRTVNTDQVAFSAVPLPTDINLNVAQTFTIKVDVVADSGRIPTGGIVFGVADSLNYCGFSLNGKGEISIIRVANGQTFGDYMPGDYFKPGVLLDRNRDRLTIRRNGDVLHFYINDQEVRSSPYPFRMLPGNGIGLTTTGYWTSFQKLTVTLGQ